MNIEKTSTVQQLSKKGQLVLNIPKDIARMCNIKDKDKLTFVFDGEKILLERGKWYESNNETYK